MQNSLEAFVAAVHKSKCPNQAAQGTNAKCRPEWMYSSRLIRPADAGHSCWARHFSGDYEGVCQTVSSDGPWCFLMCLSAAQTQGSRKWFTRQPLKVCQEHPGKQSNFNFFDIKINKQVIHPVWKVGGHFLKTLMLNVLSNIFSASRLDFSWKFDEEMDSGGESNIWRVRIISNIVCLLLKRTRLYTSLCSSPTLCAAD